MARNDDGSAPQAGKSTCIQRMDAFDRLPKSVRQELSIALLDYTAIDFYFNYRRGMQPLQLLEVLWKANIRDHKTKAKTGEVAAIPGDKLTSYKWSPDRTGISRKSRYRLSA